MKKIGIIMVLFVMLVGLAACQTEEEPDDNGNDLDPVENGDNGDNGDSEEEAVDLSVILDQYLLGFPIGAVENDDILLLDSYLGYDLAWESSNKAVMSDAGVIVRPGVGAGDETVDLTVIITDGDEQFTKTFEVVVEEERSLESLLTEFTESFEIGDEVEHDVVLPRQYGGYELSWSSSDETVFEASSGRLYRPSHGTDDVVIDLEVTLLRSDETVSWVYSFDVLAMSEEEEAAMVLFDEVRDSIDIEAELVSENLDLPILRDGVRLSWSSSDPHFLSGDGTVNLPLYRNGPKDVVLIATARVDGITRHMNFNVTINPLPEAEITIQSTKDFENLATEYLLDSGSLDIYYTEERGLPYVDILSFLTLLDGGEQTGAIVFDELDIMIKDDIFIISNFVDRESELEEDELLLMENMTYSFMFDFNTNQAKVSHFDFFGSFRESTQTDFGAGLSVADYTYEYKEPVTFDFNYYRLEIIKHEGEYLIPFHLANLFFSGSMFDFYYNGDMIYGFDTYQRNDEDVRESLLDSTYGGEEINESKLLATYNYLVFTFDHYFGLRDDYGVVSFYDEFEQKDFVRQGMTHYQTIFSEAYALDDLHTSFLMTGIYAPAYNPTLALNHLGPRTVGFYEDFWDYQDLDLCEEIGVTYFDGGRVARIRVTGFDEDTPDEFAALLSLIENRGGVEDIVVDLACNTGGIVGGMIQILGYMTNDLIPIHGINAGDLSTYTAYYESETEARDEFNWYIISSSITYSAGNMMVQIAKEMGIATIIGLDSQGGAASITTNILPTGAIIMMSSNNVSADADYNSIEMGVEVDYPMGRLRLHSETAILNAIAAAKAAQEE